MAKDFPNKWRKVANIPADKFEPLFYEDVMEWKVAGWELPPDIACVIRARNLENHKLKSTYTNVCLLLNQRSGNT